MIPNFISLMVMIDLTILIIIAIAVTSNVRSWGRIRHLGRTPNRVLLPVGLMILGGWFLADAAGRTALPALTEWSAFEEVIGSVALIGIGMIALGQHRLLRSTLEVSEALNAYSLSESDRLLRTVIDTIPQQVFVKDTQARFNLVNRAWGDFYGIQPDQCVGYTSYDLPVGNREMFDQVRETDRQVLESGETVDEVQSIELHSGAKQVRRLYKAPLRDEDGRITGIIGFSEDITDRLQAEDKLKKEEEYSRHLIETMNDGFGVVDRRGVITYANNKLCRIFGYPKEELEGWSIAERGLLDEENQRRLDEGLADRMKGESHPYELTITRKDGRRIEVHVSPRPTFDEHGAFDGSVSVITDITQQKSFEATLLDKQWIFDQAQQLANIGIWERDLRTGTLEWSAQTCRIFGWDPDNRYLTQDDLIAAIHPEDRETFIGIVKTAADRDGLFDYEHRIIRTDGVVRYVHEIGATLYDEEGQPVRRFGTVHDITDRKKAEIALEENRRLLQTVFESLPIGLFVKDADAKLIMANETHAKNLGFEASDMMGCRTTTLGLGTQAEMQLMDDSDQLVLKQGERFESTESPWTMPNGETTWWHVVKAPLKDDEGNIIGVVGARMDITERKEAQEELRLHSAIMNEMAEGVFLFRASDGVIVYSNPRNDELFGYEPEELVGNHVRIVNASGESLPEETSETIIQSLKNTGSWIGEVQNVRKDGSKFWCRARISTMEHHQLGTIWISVNENITERKQAEIDLSNNRRLLHEVFKSIPIGVFVKDRDGRLIMANEAHAAPLGISAAEMIGRHAKDLGWGSEENRRGMEETDRLVLDQGERYEVEELPWALPNGEVSWWHVVKAPFHDENGNILGIVGTRIDITERKQAEEELKESEARLASITENIPGGVYRRIMHSSGKVSYPYVSTGFQKLFGIDTFKKVPATPRETLTTAMHPGDQEGAIEALLTSAQTLETYDTEFRMVSDSGKNTWYRSIAKPHRLENGEVMWDGIVIDIHEQREATRSLKMNEELLAAVFDSLPMAVGIKDREGQYLKVNHLMADFYKMTEEEMVGKSVMDLPLSSKERLQTILEDDRKVMASGHPIINPEVEVVAPSGEISHRYIAKLPLKDDRGEVSQLLVVSQDITERKKVELALEAQKRLLQTVFDALPHWIFMKDRAGRFQMVNQALSSYFGMLPQDLIGKTFGDLAMDDPEQVERSKETDSMVLEEGKFYAQEELLVFSAEGKSTYRHVIKVPSHDVQGNVEGLVGISMDITERKWAEETLQEHQRLMQTVFDALPLWVTVKDHDLRYILHNKQVLTDLQMKSEELMASSTKTLPYGTQADKAWVVELDRKILDGEETNLVSEIPVNLPDGQTRIYHSIKVPLLDSRGGIAGVVNVSQDITDRNEAEEKLREHEQLLQTIFEALPAWVTVKDTQFRYQMVNAAALTDTGLTEEQYLNSVTVDLPLGKREEMERNLALDRKVLESGEKITSPEHPHTLADGNVHYFHHIKAPYRDSSGNIRGIVTVSLDVTERKEAEENIRESRNRLNNFIDSSPINLAYLDKDLIYRQVNARYLEFLGKSKEEIVGKTAMEIVGPENFEMYRPHLEEAMRGHEVHFEVSRLLGGKKIHHLEIKYAPDWDQMGNVQGMYVSLQDITTRKEGEEKLRESQRLLQNVFDTIPSRLFVKDQNSRYILVNKKFADDFGTKPEVWTGREAREIDALTEEEKLRFTDSDNQVFSSGQSLNNPEHLSILRDGTRKYFHFIKELMRDDQGEINGLIGLAVDISEQVEAQEKVQENQRLLQTIFDTIPEQLFVKDQESRYLMVNKAWGDFFGIDPERCQDYTADDLPVLVTNLQEEVRNTDQEVLRQGSTQVIPRLEVRLQDGSEQIRRVLKAPLFGEEGDIKGIVGFSQDITEQVRSEEELLKHRDQLEVLVTERTTELEEERNFIGTVLDTQEAMVMVMDRTGKIVRFNNACVRLTGFSEEELIGAPFFDLIVLEENREATSAVGRELKAENFPVNHENPLLTKSGEQRLVAWSTNALLDAKGEVEFVISAGIDTTERKRLEGELVQQQKLATLGQLTATVSHELRNPLGTMRTTMGVIGRIATPDDDVMTRALARMDRNITRCDNIIDEMLDYTRMKDPDLRPMVLDRWLRVMLEELEAPRGIEVLQRLEAPGAKVSIDPDRFLRVVINLYENACQAMEGQKSKEGVVPEGRLRIITTKEDGQVILTVEDNGPGIPPDVLGNIFEPLFSTKNFGVGLGLSIVQNIVDQHRGELLVETEVGRGTRFIIRLPRHT